MENKTRIQFKNKLINYLQQQKINIPTFIYDSDFEICIHEDRKIVRDWALNASGCICGTLSLDYSDYFYKTPKLNLQIFRNKSNKDIEFFYELIDILIEKIEEYCRQEDVEFNPDKDNKLLYKLINDDSIEYVQIEIPIKFQ